MKKLACGTCGNRYDDGKDCAACGDPLQDLDNHEVRQMLIDDDHRRASNQFKKMLIIAIPLGFVVMVPE